MRLLHTIILAAGLALAAPTPAMAQRGQAASVMVMDYQRIMTTSVAGRDIEARLRQIAEQMQGELQAEATAVQTEAQALQTATANRTQEQIQRDNALRTRIETFQTRAEAHRQQQVVRGRDLEYTRQQAMLEFNRQLEPIVQEVMTARRAGVVLDRAEVQLVGEGVDATADIISRLDQRVRSINVTRQTAPTQPPQGNGAPAPR